MAQSSKKTNALPRHAIAGSERRLLPGTNLLGELEAGERLSVSLVLRRRQDGPPIPDLEYWQKTPPGRRRFLTPEEFEKRHGASAADIAAVEEFATGHGLTVLEKRAGRRTVIVSGTAAQMNEAFGVKLQRYDAPKPRRRKAAAGRAKKEERQVHRGFEGPIHVPADLSAIVTDVVGLDNRLLGARDDGDPTPTNPLPVTEIAQLYQIPNSGAAGQVVGIFNDPIDGGSYDPADITACMAGQPSGYQTMPTVVPIQLTVDGTLYQNNPAAGLGGEVSQDIQIVAVIAQGVKINVYCTAYTEDGWLAYVNRVITPEAGDAVPTVLTSSWVLGHDDSDGAALLNTMTAKFQDLAALGITVFNAQGDMGSNDGSGLAQCRVQYPASDPWVTSCGGTVIGDISGGSFEEWVWNDDTGATGGGVSDFFAVPPYQTAAGIAPVSKNDGKVRRGIPDIAADASPNSGYTALVMGGSPLVGNGTSASSPLYAGLMAVMNQALGQNVGFFNPTLYELGESVCRDITNGDNNPNDGSGAPYYTAGPGWDACTGWGVVVGTELLNALKAIYARNFYFLVDKSTFSADEVKDNPIWQDAFWMVLEGFSINQANGAAIAFAGAFNGYAGLTITPDASGVQYQFPGNQYTPQRILYPFDIDFTATSYTSFPASGMSAEELLTATITVNGTMLTADTIFEVTGSADPYFTNIGPGHNEFYLSQDLRVFTITPEANNVTPIGPVPFTFTSGSPTVLDPTAAYNYIQQLIGYLNGAYSDPLGTDPFSSVLPDQTGQLTGDGSVTPTTANPHGAPFINYNFGIARVRMNGPGSLAPNTKVFFRLFNTQTFDTDYINTSAYVSGGDPNITFPSTGSPDDPQLPLPGTDQNGNINGCSIPFFAAADQSDLMAGGVNNQNLSVTSEDGLWAYFGCFLDVYDPSLMVGGQQIQYWLAGGSHHCLVAQIAYDGAPIENSGGVILNPDNCDKLAQRNLQITGAGTSDLAAVRIVPNTFDVRPSPLAVSQSKAYLVNLPDELMIDWGNTPVGSTATIYWPQVNASDVLALAAQRFGVPFLSSVDSHTIRCKVGTGLTYIPIPAAGANATGQSWAGLFTVELPAGISVGGQFNITVRRITSRQINGAAPTAGQIGVKAAAGAKGAPGQAGAAAGGLATVARVQNWRYISGVFNIRIPVSTAEQLLGNEENLLAILKWRQLLLPASNKWSPVLVRWVTFVAARVKAMGGNPSQIQPSRNGYYPVVVAGNGHTNGREAVIGKVRGLIFDRFGDFEGFTFETRGGELLSFEAHEKRVEELVRRAWTERILVEIDVNAMEPKWPARVVLLESVGV